MLTNAPQDESGVRQVVVVIPYANADQMLASSNKLASDEAYNAAAKDYLARGPKDAPYKRIRSELLVAMDCWKEAKVPAGTLENKDRVYELRLYESPTERLAALKVQMFNAGEVPIFLDCKIQPIFIGQAVIGPQDALAHLLDDVRQRRRPHRSLEGVSCPPGLEGTQHRSQVRGHGHAHRQVRARRQALFPNVNFGECRGWWTGSCEWLSKPCRCPLPARFCGR